MIYCFKLTFFKTFSVSICILIKFFLQLYYIHINIIKYLSDDLKKFKFGDKISRDTRKILFKNNIWNPDHPRQLQTINRSQNSFVEPINRNTIYKNSINRNNLSKINFNAISNPKKLINKYKPPVVYILNATPFLMGQSWFGFFLRWFRLEKWISFILLSSYKTIKANLLKDYVKKQGNKTKMVGLDMGNISIRVE